MSMIYDDSVLSFPVDEFYMTMTLITVTVSKVMNFRLDFYNDF